MSQKWYCRFAGSVQGPFTLEVLKALLRAGQVDENVPVRAESSEVWIHLGDLLETAEAAQKNPSPGSPSLSPPPPPPPGSKGSPTLKVPTKSSEFPSLDDPLPPPTDVGPRRRTSKSSKDAVVWAWIGLVGALVTVAVLLVLTLNGVIGPLARAKPKPEADDDATTTTPLVPKVDRTVDKSTSPPDPPSTKEKEPDSSSEEPVVPVKKPPVRRPEIARKTTSDVAVDPLKTTHDWFPGGQPINTTGAKEEIYVEMWLAWSDYGDPVTRFEMDDIEPESETAKGAASKSDSREEEMDPESEEPKSPRKRPGQKPEFVFAEITVRKMKGAPIEFQTWNGTADKKFLARLFDDQGREIPAVPASGTKSVKRLDKGVQMANGAVVRDAIVFEVPKHRFEKLRLLLPVASIGIEATSPYIGFDFAPSSLGREEVDPIGAKFTEAPETEEESSEPETKRPKLDSDSESKSE